MPLVCAKTVGIVKTVGTDYSLGMDKDSMRRLATVDQVAQAHREATHEALVNAIWEAADTGWPQVDIVAASGLTRERIRQICDSEYRERALERRKKAQR